MRPPGLNALPDSAQVTVSVGWLRQALGAAAAEDSPPDRLAPLTVADVAREVGRSESTVRGWLASGELEGFRVGREWRVRAAAVEEYYRAAEAAHGGEEAEDDPEDADLGAWRDSS